MAWVDESAGCFKVKLYFPLKVKVLYFLWLLLLKCGQWLCFINSLSLELDFSFSFTSCWCYWLVLIGLTRSDQIRLELSLIKWASTIVLPNTMTNIRMHSCDQQLSKTDQLSHCEATRADQSMYDRWQNLRGRKVGPQQDRMLPRSSSWSFIKAWALCKLKLFYDMLFFSI